jgi:transposase
MAMSRLGDAIDGVIGVDTHRDTLAGAATDMVGGLLAQTSVSADAAGYRRLFDFAQAQVPGRRCWAVEGAGSYGAGLTVFLQTHGERVVEVGRPKRPPRRSGAKSDALDAVRAAREALAQDHVQAPRQRGDREAIRVLLATRHSACAAKISATNQLKALIVGAPEELRAELRGLTTKRQVTRCALLRDRPTRSLEHRMTVRALRSTAQRIRLLAAEAAELRAELERLVAGSHPGCWSCPGWGRSAPPRSWSAGRTPVGFARRPHLLPWLVSTRSRRRLGR